MAKPNNSTNQKQTLERREKISVLLSRGYSQGDIMKELGITTMIYNRDMKTINEINTKQFYELAKANPLTVISECVNDLDRILKECWKIHDDSETNANDRLVALRTISEINDKKLSMSQEMLDNYHHDRDLT